jgi:hypothetical protein
VSEEKSRLANEWMHMPPDSRDWGNLLDRSRWHTVLDSKESVAETMLETASSVLLTEKEAFELAGPFARSTSTSAKPFLLRAVGPGFHIYTRKDGNVSVMGGGLFHRRVTPERRPIVAWLDHQPRDVFVSFSAAE